MRKMLAIWLVVVFVLFIGLKAELKTVPLFKTGQGNPVPDEVLVTFNSEVSGAEKAAIAQSYGLTKVRESWKTGRYTLYRHTSPDSVIQSLEAHPQVKFAERNIRYYPAMVPNDPLYDPYQWHFPIIGMPSAWNLSSGGGVVVAVLDTGVYQGLPDFAGTLFTAGYDFADNDSDPTDEGGWSNPAQGGDGTIFSHGSHVAGTIAQTTNNFLGCAGIAYDAVIMPVRVLSTYNGGASGDIADGIDYAVANGADIINLSLGGYGISTRIRSACDDAWAAGVLVIAAAGNDATDTLFYPASYSSVMSVSATNYSDTPAFYSNYGTAIEIAAPGGEGPYEPAGSDYAWVFQNAYVIPSGLDFYDLDPSHMGYFGSIGTSMAAPHVAGVAALMKAARSSATNFDIRNALLGSAVDLGPAGWDAQFGHGRLDAYEAIKKMLPWFYLDRYCFEILQFIPPMGSVDNYYVEIGINFAFEHGYPEYPMAGIAVTGQWSGLVDGPAYGVTNSEGQVIFTSPYTAIGSGTITLNVTGADFPLGGEYNPEMNQIPTIIHVTIGGN
ncbi:MAG: peptidase S8 [bacterium]|nr:peptidase S8 [bacterium]